MKTTLNRRRLEAMEEALSARLAAEIEDVGNLEIEDYWAALRWVREQIRKRLERKISP